MHRLADQVWLDRAVDEPSELRRADLRFFTRPRRATEARSFATCSPFMVKYIRHDREELLREAEKVLVANGVVKEGDLIVLTIGEPIGRRAAAPAMKIVRVGEHLKP